MDIFAVGEPELMHAARTGTRGVEKADGTGLFRNGDVEQLEAGGL
jgi:hypothetical protein